MPPERLFAYDSLVSMGEMPMIRTRTITLVLCLTTAAAMSAATAQNIAMFRGDAAHRGVYAGQPIASQPKLKWTFHTRGRVYSSPAVAGGTVFIGSTDQNLYAIDAATGAQKWKFRTDSRVTSSPAVANGFVYFGSFDGNFYAVDAGTGAVKWKFATAGEHRFTANHIHGMYPATETMPDPFDFFLSSPAVADGTVYFGSGDGNVYALDAASGALKWKFATGDVVHASPAVADGMVFVGSWDSYFYALDAASGALKWKFKTGEDHDIHNQQGIQSSAAVADGIVVFGCRDSNLYALDEKTGRQIWAQNNKGSWVIASPAIRDRKVYVATSDSGKFFAIDARSGAVTFSVDFKRWPTFSSPALIGDYAYVGSWQGKLFAIDLKNGRTAWEFQTDASRKLLGPHSNPDGSVNYYAVQAGTFYDDMVVSVSNLMDGGAILSSPVYANGLLIFGSADGNVYALGT